MCYSNHYAMTCLAMCTNHLISNDLQAPLAGLAPGYMFSHRMACTNTTFPRAKLARQLAVRSTGAQH
jgi:hypothetical protein